jgi:hypothetical protein
MSSKKALRRKRREEERQESRKKGINPALLFILGIGLAVLGTVAFTVLFGDSSAPGPPPTPGAVWSEAHGHWH